MKYIIILSVCFFITANSFSMHKKRLCYALSKSADCIHSQEYTELQNEKRITITQAEKAIGKKLNAPAPLFKVIRPKVFNAMEEDDKPAFFEQNKNVIVIGGIGLGIGAAALVASHIAPSHTSKT